MNHEHHGGMMGAMEGSGGDMGGMPGGMPVAFDWGIRVTLFFDSWATETAFDCLVALVGVFLLCIALLLWGGLHGINVGARAGGG